MGREFEVGEVIDSICCGQDLEIETVAPEGASGTCSDCGELWTELRR